MQKIDDPYIDKLIDTLAETVFCKGMEEASTYSDGMEMLVGAFLKHKTDRTSVYFIGNGGSAAIASHMTADFLKNGGLATVSLYDFPTLTCLGNDYTYDDIFARQLELHAKENELLVTISSSGNSENIFRAIEVAKDSAMDVITFTGFKPDNRTRASGDMSVYVPSEEYGVVETIHNLILQQAVDEIMRRG